MSMVATMAYRYALVKKPDKQGWMQRRLFGLASSEASVQALTIALPNYAAAGLPLIAAVYGATGTIYVALSIATSSIVLSPADARHPRSQQGAGGRAEKSRRGPAGRRPLTGQADRACAARLRGVLIARRPARGGCQPVLSVDRRSGRRCRPVRNRTDPLGAADRTRPQRAEWGAPEERAASSVGVRLDPGASHGPGRRAGRASAVRSALRLLVRLALRPQLPPSHRELCQSCVEDAAADVVKEDVDPFGAPLL
jgi:hypothetical protein